MGIMLGNFVKRAIQGYKALTFPKRPIPKKELPPKPPELPKIEGFEIPIFIPSKVRIEAIKGEERVPISLSYPLIPRKPAKGETVFASANISWDPKLNKYIYKVIEPEKSEKLNLILAKMRELLEQKLDIDFSKLKRFEAIEFLHKTTDELLDYFKIMVTEEERRILHYYIERDFVGLGRIEPLFRDPEIEDISCDGLGIPIFVFHRNPKLASVVTNVSFENADELDSFIIRLSQMCGKSISVASPLVGGSLPDGSRLQATLATDIARRGSNFTIRKFTEQPLTPIHLLNYNTLDIQVLAFLWMVVDFGKSILISGGTASGKTSLLNVLSLFIRSEKKVCSIEDTPELKLPHPHWVPHVARVPMTIEESKKIGEVDLFDLLRESLRQRPDYIIVGEVRGREAFVLFQEMASIPGNEKVWVLNGNNLKRIPITEIEPNKKYKVITIDPSKEKVKIVELGAKIIHSPQMKLYKIKTKTGREVVTTGYHSVFTYTNTLEPLMVEELKVGDKIVIPAKLPSGFADIEFLNLLEVFPDIRVLAPEYIKMATKTLGFKKASRICKVKSISDYYGKKKSSLPAEKFKELMKEAKINFDIDKIKVKFERRSSSLPARFQISQEFLRLLGYYVSEGTINVAKKNNSISLYNQDEDILRDMRECIIKVTGKRPRERVTNGYSYVTELNFNHKVLFEFFKRFCGINSHEKKIPDFVFGLSKEKIAQLLSTAYLGDGSLNRRDFSYWTSSTALANDILILLLMLGIVGNVYEERGKKSKVYHIAFYRKDYQEKFLEHVNFLGKKVEIRGSSRKKDKKEIFLDEIKSVEEINLENPISVFDLKVPGSENFIGGFGGIMLHNTGHPSLATIHAENTPKLIDRLTTPPIALPASLLGSLDLVVFLLIVRHKDRYVRRINEIFEIIGVDPKTKSPITNQVFRWNAFTDKFEISGKSFLLKKISESTGLTEQQIKDELERRMFVLNWMKEKNITDYKDVFNVFSMYYSYPERVLSTIKGGT